MIKTHQQEKGRQNGAHSTTETDSLEECKAFMAKTLKEKTKWILQAGLCYRCLSEGHRAKDCRQTSQRTPPQREAKETRRWRVGRHEMHIPVRS